MVAAKDVVVARSVGAVHLASGIIQWCTRPSVRLGWAMSMKYSIACGTSGVISGIGLDIHLVDHDRSCHARSCSMGCTSLVGLKSGASDGQGSRPIQKGALQPLTLEEMSNNPFGFSYHTEEGKTYKVECSTDLIRWYEVDLAKGTGKEVKFTDKRQRVFQQQFYRVVLE